MALTIRCSALPRIMKCPASAIEPAMIVDAGDPSAALGTAVHAWLADRINGTSLADPKGDDEYIRLCLTGAALWEHLSEWFPKPATEVELSCTRDNITLTGHADLVSVPETSTMRLLDWKTGHIDEDAEEQLRGYAFLALALNPHAESVSACLARVRDMSHEWFTWDRIELDDWWRALINHLSDLNHFAPDPKTCRYCPHAHNCRAALSMTVNAVMTMLTPGPISGNNPNVLAEVYDRIGLVEKACQDARKGLHLLTDRQGGVLRFGDGREMVRQEQERKEIEFAASWPIIGEAAKAKRSNEIFKVHKTGLEKWIKDNTPKGQKEEAVKEVLDRLKEVGAIQTKSFSRYEVRRVVPQLQHEEESENVGIAVNK